MKRGIYTKTINVKRKKGGGYIIALGDTTVRVSKTAAHGLVRRLKQKGVRVRD